MGSLYSLPTILFCYPMYAYTIIYTYIGALSSLYPVYPGYTTCHQIFLYSMYAYTNNPIFYICIYRYIHIYRDLILFN